MAAIRAKNTKPEIVVRKYLWSHGFRYRLNHPRLPGKPDIVLRKYRTCIFVNGCFWHGHEGCKYFVMPKSRTDFWQAKITRNQERDIEVQKKLASMGWHSLRCASFVGSYRWKNILFPRSIWNTQNKSRMCQLVTHCQLPESLTKLKSFNFRSWMFNGI